MTVTTVDESLITAFIDQAMAEDVGEGDHTSLATIPNDARSKAKLLVKDACVLAGVDLAKHIFQRVDPTSTVNVMIPDGTGVRYGDIAFEVECNAQALLRAERLVLNTMQRMSGIATLSNRFMFEVGETNVTVLDTRKTTPLIRFIEKWAVRIGGCTNYRHGLYDWIMVKDNHIDACGGIPQAIKRVEEYQKEKGLNLGFTIEVRNLVELYQVIEHGEGVVTRIMLDNFELPLLKEAVAIIGDKFESEASGGVNIHTIRKIAKAGVDFISVGALTHSAQSMDLSLKVIK